MRPGRASRTASWVAFARGLGAWESPSIHEDPLAEGLLSPPWSTALGLARRAPGVARAWLRAADAASGGRTRFMSLRTRVLDDLVCREAERGVTQLVILGAGLDARAWRLGAALARTTVFEVDHPDTQALKVSRLGDRPAHAARVRMVPVDLARDPLGPALQVSGFDPALPATVIWEGVVMYLTSAAIDGSLAALRVLLAPGSSLGVSYSRTGSRHDRLLREGVALGVRAAGERFRHHEEPHEMARRLNRAGFAVVSDEGHPDWSPRFLGREARWDIQRIVIARA